MRLTRVRMIVLSSKVPYSIFKKNLYSFLKQTNTYEEKWITVGNYSTLEKAHHETVIQSTLPSMFDL